jgi:hypothetical protein
MTNGTEADAEADAELEPDSIFGIDLDEPAEVWTEVDLEAAAEAEPEIEAEA